MKNIFSIIIIIVALASFVLVVKPQYDKIREMQKTESELGGVLDNARKLQSLRDSLLDKFQKLATTDINRLEKLIPESADNVKLILEFEQMAARHDLEINSASAVKDGESEEDAKNPTKKEGEDTFDVETKDYGIITLDFTLAGSYSGFISFLEELEKNIRITDIRNLTIAPPQGTGSDYEYQLSVETYWLKDNI